MKRIIVFLIYLLMATPISAQDMGDRLVGDIPIAVFGTYSTDTVRQQYYSVSRGQCNLVFDFFPQVEVGSCDWPSMRAIALPHIVAHPGYASYIFMGADCNVATFFDQVAAGSPRHGLAFVQSAFAHEMAHTLGMQHYGGITCIGNYVDETCSLSAGVGTPSLNSFPAAYAYNLGWIDAPVVTTNATLELPVGQAVRLHLPNNPLVQYAYVSYRNGVVMVEGEQITDYLVPHWIRIYNMFHLDAGDRYCLMDGNTFVATIEATSIYGVSAFISIDFDGCSPPICQPMPTQYQTLSCPPGYRGSITQQRVSTCPGPTWGPWQTISNTCRKGGKK